MNPEICETIDLCIESLLKHRDTLQQLADDKRIIGTHNKLIELLESTKTQLNNSDPTHNYTSLFKKLITSAISHSTSDNIDINHLSNPNHQEALTNFIDERISTLKLITNQFTFNLDFFQKLGFFNQNIVAIGANGSGKTSLSNSLKSHLSDNGIVISAQKVLLIPTFEGISNIHSTATKLRSAQGSDKSLKITYNSFDSSGSFSALMQVGKEFHILLDNLLAERNFIRNNYCEETKQTKKYSDVPTSLLDQALTIWNNLLPHRTISCPDGVNIILQPENGEVYPAYQMSDGEKVLLFQVAQVLQSPKNGYIVVDEPEMFLHKTIVNKLWDVLEVVRDDCIFIYLTHDLDFAINRINAKKVWLKSYTHPDNWLIEDIPQNDLPEQMLLELLGSRKDILFCEGKKDRSHDVKIYNILFPHYTVCPVESCFDVIHHTKAFNKISNINTKAYGIIDSDHHSRERLMALEPESIFSFSMAEIENLFLNENFLNAIAIRVLKGSDTVQLIKNDILAKLKTDQEIQISNYISTKINYYFHDSHVSQGNSLQEVESHLSTFIDRVKLQQWYSERKSEIDKIILEKNYIRALEIYNNKGLKSVAQRHLGITNFSEISLSILIAQPETQNILKSHFPATLHQ